MKKRSKEINIFNMSVVDLFACTMGAFILIALILFPYYLKSDPAPCEPCPEPTSCPICEPCPTVPECPPIPECPICPPESVAKKDYLLVIMSWTTEDDIDMHIKDPRGAVYKYDSRQHSHSPAKFAEDNTRGPGNEIWVHPPEVMPGIYEVFYHWYPEPHISDNVTVEEAKIITQQNQYEIPDCRLRRPDEKRKVATINVDEEGNVRVAMHRCN